MNAVGEMFGFQGKNHIKIELKQINRHSVCAFEQQQIDGTFN